ncbi:glycosyltransferase family 9 protein [Sphingobacterium sp. MYb382]|uniref:glycosyltransferase family 9 protein n=1 Tax=Sphingobacterium sp. MYb382 TaxID=2745278 RepID=UPI00309BE58B
MRIAIFCPLELGSMLCAMPAIRCVKKNFPQAKLYVIGSPGMEEFIMRYKFVRDFIPFSFPKLESEDNFPLDNVEEFVQDICELKVDLLIQLYGNGSGINDLLKRCEAKQIVGFCPDELSADSSWMVYPDGMYEVDRYLKLLRYIGCVVTEDDYRMEFPINSGDIDEFSLFENLLNKKYAVIHIARRGIDDWCPFDDFSLLARYLQEKNYEIILTGRGAEDELVTPMKWLKSANATNLLGRTNLGQFACLLKNACVFISNSAGASHFARALETKSMVLSLDIEPRNSLIKNNNLHYNYDAIAELDFSALSKDLNRLISS